MGMVNSILKWTATAFTVAGAMAVSMGIDPLNIWLLNIGSLLWMAWGYRIKESSILAVNGAMLAIYAGGLVTRL